MNWYWWILIITGIVVIGYIKIKIGQKMMANIKKRREKKEKYLEDE